MFKKLFLTTLSVLFLSALSFGQQKKVLVFSKTAGYRHSSIEAGIEFFKKVGSKENISFSFSENSEDIDEDNLTQYNAVVFLNTTGNILNDRQQADFERYIQAGGGFMGIHAAADTEYEWPWYNRLLGAYFASHPGGDVSNIQNGKMTVHSKKHPATAHLATTFERKDEFYDFKSVQKEAINVLISVDEKSYKQGKMGDWHPMAWYHEFDGGKVFYSNFGHVESTFESEENMQIHLTEGLKSVLAEKLDYTKVRSQRAPEENRFIKTTLANNLYEPTELAILPNGKVLVVERRGEVKLWNPETEVFSTINKFDVFSGFEYGLMGIGVDPNFSRNNWIYLYYTPNTDEHTDNYLSRFTYNPEKDEIDISSEKIVLRVKVKKNECCHTGGSIDWDAKGNLYLSTGDDTNPFASDGYGPMDFTPGREGWDALRSSANTNDLRGKVLRIKPEKDGTYSIPQGNLYPVGTPNTRPEIFIMGSRNPYRISVDKRTGDLYWGDIGPDAGKPNPDRGSEGLVEFNRTKEPGFYGWPMFVGNNRPYKHYNFETKVSGEPYDAANPVNDSPNNTGLKNLPPTREPLIYYGYGDSEDYPLFGKGGCNPMAGPVYYSDDYKENEHRFPSYFDGKFFAYEWIRDWIILVDFDEKGNVAGMEKFMPSTKFNHPMDMAFNSNGVLYLLEYGQKWFAQNEDAALSRIEFNPNNRPPSVKIAVAKNIGAAPLKTSFSSEGTVDFDGDELTYSWDFGGGAENSSQKNAEVTFKTPGEYTVTLTVKDSKGSVSKETLQMKVGNEIPEVEIEVTGNQSFYLGENDINYQVKVKDKEDGTLGKGIKPENVVVSINYLEGYDKNQITIGHQQNLAFSNGRRLIEEGDCLACHQVNEKSIGPSYKQVAEKYPKSRENTEKLAKKIIGGGGGVWGETSMAAHPDLKMEDATAMVQYILSINDKKAASLPSKGTYKANAHEGKKAGAYVIQASYQDNGGKTIGSQIGSSSLALRSANIPAVDYDKTEGTLKFDVPQVGELVIANDGAFVMYEDIDLTSLNTIKVGAFGQANQTVGGKIIFRSGSKDGKKLGEINVPAANMVPLELKLGTVPAGKKNLYLIFENKNSEGKPLFGLSFLEFSK
ncbi:MAG: ThuA domain-containing protein [Cytophagales bacterium]|nr:ThuA domain-containing protein [Cytophagales bacterium]